MTQFIYNNAKITNIGYIQFKFNYEYYLPIFFEKRVEFC